MRNTLSVPGPMFILYADHSLIIDNYAFVEHVRQVIPEQISFNLVSISKKGYKIADLFRAVRTASNLFVIDSKNRKFRGRRLNNSTDLGDVL